MKHIASAVGCFSLILFLVTQSGLAQGGQPSKFYVRIHGGAGVAQDVEVKQFASTPGLRGLDLEFKPGVSIDVGGGYQVTEWFAAEVQAGYTWNLIDQIKGAPRVHFNNSRVSTVPLMLNGVLQYPTRMGLVPYAGAGIGGSFNVFNGDEIFIYEGASRRSLLDDSDADAVFAYQFFAGLRYRINPQMEVNVGYRYFGTQDSSWEFDGSWRDIDLEGMSVHSATLSFLYRF